MQSEVHPEFCPALTLGIPKSWRQKICRLLQLPLPPIPLPPTPKRGPRLHYVSSTEDDQRVQVSSGVDTLVAAMHLTCRRLGPEPPRHQYVAIFATGGFEDGGSTLALWIACDGDDTDSTFGVRIRELVLE
jgi:hypothetical protein